jgi:hypothetical protein
MFSKSPTKRSSANINHHTKETYTAINLRNQSLKEYISLSPLNLKLNTLKKESSSFNHHTKETYTAINLTNQKLKPSNPMVSVTKVLSFQILQGFKLSNPKTKTLAKY